MWRGVKRGNLDLGPVHLQPQPPSDLSFDLMGNRIAISTAQVPKGRDVKLYLLGNFVTEICRVVLSDSCYFLG